MSETHWDQRRQTPVCHYTNGDTQLRPTDVADRKLGEHYFEMIAMEMKHGLPL